MVLDHSRMVRQVTFLLLALAALAVEVAANDGRASIRSFGLASIWIMAAAVLARLLPLPVDARKKPPLWCVLIVAILAVVPFGYEPLRRDWTGDGYPLEIQMICSLRNMGLGLAAFAGWHLCLRLACVVSLFLMLFSAAMTNHPAVLIVLGLYTAAGSIWLMLMYWSGLKNVFVKSAQRVEIRIEPGKVALPWTPLLLLMLALSVSAGLLFFTPRRITQSLGEWLGTSGGTGDTDPFARYGIGDGPEETAGNNAQTAGMVETDKMIEDNKNSLIDAVNDMYGPPHKPPKNLERMVAAGFAEIIKFHGKLPDNRKPSRDFGTSRTGPKSDRKPESHKARGLFEVQGRTPLHIRVVAYEKYDAAEKRWNEGRKPSSRLLDELGDDWMSPTMRRIVPWYAADERHKLKTADMKSNLVPTPTLLKQFRIKKVNRADYYTWDYDGVLSLSGRSSTPPGVVITTDCHTVDASVLPPEAFEAFVPGGAPPVFAEIPEELRPRFRSLGEAWTQNLPRGWPQIHAVITHLKSEFTLDAEAVAPADHPCPVLWFLDESRRGPDYLFASAAALILRALDYPTRVCLGYYVSPTAYDPETEHTPVRQSDLHLWPEVLLRDGHWLVLEPTPGYEVLPVRLPLGERIARFLGSVASFVQKHWLPVSAVFVAVLVLVIRRRQLRDLLALLVWRWFPARDGRGQLFAAVRILERRARWSGSPRPTEMTQAHWLRTLPGSDATATRLAELSEWAAYAPVAWELPDTTELRPLCEQVLGRWTLKMFSTTLSHKALGASAG